MNSYPLITCYVLTYKNFDNVFSTIQSILDQDYPSIELGVFDDGSSDFPREEIERYIEKNKKENIKKVIIHSNNTNLGTVKNLNGMIDCTSGKFLIGLSADDEFNNQFVCNDIVDFFEENDADIVTSYKLIMNEDNMPIKTTPTKRTFERLKHANSDEQYKRIAFGAPIYGAGTYYSRRILEKYDFFDESFLLQEDGPFLLRATRNGDKIYFMDSVTYIYRIGAGVSSGHGNNPKLIQDVKLMFSKEIDPFVKNYNFFEKRRITYQKERITKSKKLSILEKMVLLIKYFDVVVYRMIYSH